MHSRTYFGDDFESTSEASRLSDWERVSPVNWLQHRGLDLQIVDGMIAVGKVDRRACNNTKGVRCKRLRFSHNTSPIATASALACFANERVGVEQVGQYVETAVSRQKARKMPQPLFLGDLLQGGIEIGNLSLALPAVIEAVSNLKSPGYADGSFLLAGRAVTSCGQPDWLQHHQSRCIPL